MDNSKIGTEDVPEGFSTIDPTSSSPQNNAQQQQQQQKQAQRQAILEQALTPEALERLRRIKLVKPERASAVEANIVSMALQGKLTMRMSEGKLIEMLERMLGKEEQTKGDAGKISIQRKKYAFDSDDDDDNDDDLL